MVWLVADYWLHLYMGTLCSLSTWFKGKEDQDVCSKSNSFVLPDFLWREFWLLSVSFTEGLT